MFRESELRTSLCWEGMKPQTDKSMMLTMALELVLGSHTKTKTKTKIKDLYEMSQ
jgi:hypothetical protein